MFNHPIKIKQGGFFLSLYILLFLNKPHNSTLQHCGITSTLEDLQQIIQGIQTFTAKISSFTNLLGANTILLFLFVIILSIGITTLGIKKGKTSFLTALLIADFIWIFWEESFNPDSKQYLFKILKSNAFLLTPLIAISIIKWISPSFFRNFKKFFPSFITKKKHKFQKKQLLQFYEEYNTLNSEIERSIIRDISDSEESENIPLSEETEQGLKELRNIISTILEKSK